LPLDPLRIGEDETSTIPRHLAYRDQLRERWLKLALPIDAKQEGERREAATEVNLALRIELARQLRHSATSHERKL
jgi:hypothetical protein